MRSHTIPRLLVILSVLLAACSGGGSSASPSAAETDGAAQPSAQPGESSGEAAVPEGAENTTITDWTDPRDAAWAEDYPLFAPVEIGDGSLKRVQDAGKLVICTALGIAPWNELDPATEEVVGIEPSFVPTILETIGVAEVEFLNLEFQALIPALQADQCDMISASLGIRADRAEQIRYTLPWVLTYDQFAVATDTGYQSSVDLVDKKIGTFQGSADEDVLRAWVEDNGNQAEILYFNTPNECFLATTNGTIDACFTDNVSISAAVEELEGLTVIPEAFDYAAGFPDDAARNPYKLLAIGPSTRLEDQDLNLAVALAVKKIIESGEQQEVLEQYGLWDEEFQSDYIRPDA